MSSITSQVSEKMSSLLEDAVSTATEKAREEGKREALTEFLRSLKALSDEVDVMIEEVKTRLPEDGEDDQEEDNGEGVVEAPKPGALSKRARACLDYLIDHKRATVKDLENHLGCSNAAANLSLNELVRANRATKVFEDGRAIFRPISLSRAA